MERVMSSGWRALASLLKKGIVEVVLLPMAGVIAYLLAHISGNPAHKTFYKNGFHLLKRHFYLPIPDDADVSDDFWDKQSDLIGLEMNEQVGLEFMKSTFPAYLDEFRVLFSNVDEDSPTDFFLINGSYMAIDAHVYYSFIRKFRPKQIIEIGGGYSTILANVACGKNWKESGELTKITVIEPYPSAKLRSMQSENFHVIEKRVQEISGEVFCALEENDILFIDSSHVLRAGGDVQAEYLEILPRLATGVLVHVHDISLPKAYPKVYYDAQLYWNEQYLLQAFLIYNSKFEIIWPGNYMMVNYSDRVSALFPEYHVMRQQYPHSEPSAFWMRVR